ncbi:hypothetical protein Tco_1386981 [Tanacetum coccineum]
MESELWSLTIKGTDVVGYTQRFQELALLCPRMVLDEEKKIERAYSAGPEEKKTYARTLPFCNKCKFHHVGSCTIKCGNYKRVGHMTRDCRTPVPATTQGSPVANLKATITCYEYGKQGHY